jgi:hypothetical protein
VKRLTIVVACLWLILMGFVLSPPAAAQTQTSSAQNTQAINDLEQRVFDLEREFNKFASGALILWLFGTVCALWAIYSGRNPWVWFFFGYLFSFFTVLFMLAKAGSDKAEIQATGGYPPLAPHRGYR